MGRMEEQTEHVAFDEIGERYDEAFTQRSAQIAAGAWLTDRTGPRSRVLDLGCGSGWPTAQQLAEGGLDIVGVDTSERMLEKARERVPSGEFVHADMRELPEDIGRFDAVTAFFSLLMLPRADIDRVLATVRSLLHPGAPFALGMVDGDLDDTPGEFFGVQVRFSAYPEDELIAVVRRAGFTVETVQRQEIELTPGEFEDQLYLYAVAE